MKDHVCLHSFVFAFIFFFHLGYIPCPPFVTLSRKAQAYTIKSCLIELLCRLSPHADILVSHAWATNSALSGNIEFLYRKRPDFREQVEAGTLGSKLLTNLVNYFQPRYHLASHMHLRYSGIIQHPPATSTLSSSDSLPTHSTHPADDHIFSSTQSTPLLLTPGGGAQSEVLLTYFLALDKVTEPHETFQRDFLQLIRIKLPHSKPSPTAQPDVPLHSSSTPSSSASIVPSPAAPPSYPLQYDPEWLALIRLLHPYISYTTTFNSRFRVQLPSLLLPLPSLLLPQLAAARAQSQPESTLPATSTSLNERDLIEEEVHQVEKLFAGNFDIPLPTVDVPPSTSAVSSSTSPVLSVKQPGLGDVLDPAARWMGGEQRMPRGNRYKDQHKDTYRGPHFAPIPLQSQFPPPGQSTLPIPYCFYRTSPQTTALLQRLQLAPFPHDFTAFQLAAQRLPTAGIPSSSHPTQQTPQSVAPPENEEEIDLA